ncbi:MAG: hypothetical protein CL933_22050 [Deltaproteobacteria bacterium]|nr:hypothetical protein [Deltaproteobacteria bacterium]
MSPPDEPTRSRDAARLLGSDRAGSPPNGALGGARPIFPEFGPGHGWRGKRSERDFEAVGRIGANSPGSSWNRIRASDLLMVEFDGELIEGERPLNAVRRRYCV